MSQQKRNSRSRRAKRNKLLAFDPRCVFCRTPLTPLTATLDHIIPRNKGGGWEIENMNVACYRCNQDRGDMDFNDFKATRKQWPGPRDCEDACHGRLQRPGDWEDETSLVTHAGGR